MLAADVKAVPADTTQPVIGHVAQRPTAERAASVTGNVHEKSYITLLQRQQQSQMKQIQELEERLKQQQRVNQELQQGQTASVTQPEPTDQGSKPRFQLPSEVFAQIQALTGMVNQPNTSAPGTSVDQKDEHQQQAGEPSFQQSFRPAYEEQHATNTFTPPLQQQVRSLGPVVQKEISANSGCGFNSESSTCLREYKRDRTKPGFAQSLLKKSQL